MLLALQQQLQYNFIINVCYDLLKKIVKTEFIKNIYLRLPQDIYQTAKVAKVLMLLEKGKGREFKGKSLEEIHLDNDVYYSSESDVDVRENNLPLAEMVLKRIGSDQDLKIMESHSCGLVENDVVEQTMSIHSRQEVQGNFNWSNAFSFMTR